MDDSLIPEQQLLRRNMGFLRLVQETDDSDSEDAGYPGLEDEAAAACIRYN